MSPFDQFRFHLCCAFMHAVKAIAAAWCSRAREVALWIAAGTFAILFFTGCALPGSKQLAEVKASGILAGGQAQAPKDNGTPATVASSGEETRLELPANTVITETRVEAQPAVPATVDTPAVPAQPATITREIHLVAPSAIVQKAQRVDTRTGTIDTTVALRKVDAAEARWLLWAAIACGIAGLVVKSMLPAWPGISNGLLAGAVFAFAAWKFSALPAWIFLVPIGILGAKALGYKRAEWDANGDGIPDALQRKTPPSGSQL